MNEQQETILNLAWNNIEVSATLIMTVLEQEQEDFDNLPSKYQTTEIVETLEKLECIIRDLNAMEHAINEVCE